MAVDEDKDLEFVKVGDLNSYSRRVNTIVKVVSKTDEREVTSRLDQSSHRVAEALVGDDSGSIYLTLWDDIIDEIEEGQILNVSNAYVNLFRGSMRLNLGRFGSYEVAESASFDEVNLDNNLSNKQVEQRRDYGRGGYGGRDRRYGGRSRRRY